MLGISCLHPAHGWVTGSTRPAAAGPPCAADGQAAQAHVAQQDEQPDLEHHLPQQEHLLPAMKLGTGTPRSSRS